MTLEPRSKWKFVGPGMGQALIHTVTSVERDCVTTWSEPMNHPTVGGFSWIGEPTEFLKEFQFVSPAPKGKSNG